MSRYVANYSLKLGQNKMQYESNSPLQEKIIIKGGQRKLLITTFMFMKKIKSASTIIYAGAASGRNMKYIIEAFPQHDYYLYDPAKFDDELINYCEYLTNVKIINDYFTNEKCHELKHLKNVHFISDIRRTKTSVMEDMLLQRQWVEILKPVMSFLKFRFAYCSDPGLEFEYFAGTIYKQPNIGGSSTEGRLLVRELKYCNYNVCDYENRMYYFNRIERLAFYDFEPINGLCHCWDCWATNKIFDDKKWITIAEKLNPVDIPPHNQCKEVKLVEMRLQLVLPSTKIYYQSKNHCKLYLTRDGVTVSVNSVRFVMRGEKMENGSYVINCSSEKLIQIWNNYSRNGGYAILKIN